MFLTKKTLCHSVDAPATVAHLFFPTASTSPRTQSDNALTRQRNVFVGVVVVMVAVTKREWQKKMEKKNEREAEEGRRE